MKHIIQKSLLLVLLWIAFCLQLTGQTILKGIVSKIDENSKTTPVAGAILQWLGTHEGTFSAADGTFSIPKSTVTHQLVVKYQTFQNDTISVTSTQTYLEIIISGANTLDAVEISAHQGAYISVKPILTTTITMEGLRKAACCNLSESFDNTVAVDVEYADAVSGAKQISMLGLSGIYSQILFENTPFVRLLSNQFGLGFVPGTWMESISVSKGISSVTNGYEAITGQINIEYKKPETNTEKLFINFYGNSMAKGELNMNTRFKVKENVSTMFLLHTEGQFAKWDMNHDGFMDVPLNYQINAMNRWDYSVPGKFIGRVMVSYIWEDRRGGQMDYRDVGDLTVINPHWGMKIKTNKLDFITKNGFLLKGKDESIGTILAFTYHDNNALFGRRMYHVQQLSGYANVLYSNKYGSKDQHKITVGVSVQIDELQDKEDVVRVADLPFHSLNVNQEGHRFEVVPGAFAEYSFSIDEKFIIMPGMRIDYNFLYNQLFWTPRLHLKWSPVPNSSIRISAGKGYRTANVLAENISLLISNREFKFENNLQPEEAYNAGISFVQSFDMKGDKSAFAIDYYYTHFVNQTIIDLDRDPSKVYVGNLRGNSFSHSLQAELTLYPIKRFEIIVAYRFNSVWMTTNDVLQTKALAIPHKALLNLNYATKFDKWKFNVTLQFNGRTRLPNVTQTHDQNFSAFRLPDKSKPYFILNAQITKKLRAWEIYIGGENLINVRQSHPILGADDPFGSHFDGSIIYAPITGIMGYVGFRWNLK
ncbi:MAG: TonB-dependent receptor [Bacteroidales bacterium]|nr:TonB-dependent receptor [Bacteroidales bacterium]